MKKISLISLLAFATIVVAGCYTDVVDNFKTWSFQIIVEFDPEYVGRNFPCDKLEFNNLNEFDEYKSNHEKIKSAEIVQFNYWIDSLEIFNGHQFNKITDTIVFDYVRYSLVFAKLKSGYTDATSLDSTHYEPDLSKEEFELAQYPLNGEDGVNASTYWRDPSHIVLFSEERAKVISNLLKNTPSYYIRTQYGNCVYNGATINTIKYIKARFDLALRVTVEL